MLDGYIKLYRQSIESRVFKNADLWKVWTWCLMKANHEENWVPVITGKGETEILIKPGQFIFGRKSAAEELNMAESSIRNRIDKLKNMKNIDVKPDSHYSIINIINWDSYQNNNKKQDRQKDNQRTGKGQAKDTNKNDKNDKNIYSPNSNEFRLANFLFNHIRKRNPNFKEPDIQKWALHIDYMLRIDLRPLEEIKQIIELCQKDDFWQNNILSTEKLRKQYDQLVLKLLTKTQNPSFGTCPKCRCPNIDLMENGLCKDCNR